MNIFDAIKQNDIHSIKQIIHRDPSVIHRGNIYHHTPLYTACIYGRTEIAQLLIKAGSDVGAKDKDGWTPLHWACRYGYTDVAQCVINAGADVRVKNKLGWTPLHLACYCNLEEILALLTHHSVEWLVVNTERHTPLDLAIEKQSSDVLVFLETIIDQLPDSERKKIQARRFRQELSKTS